MKDKDLDALISELQNNSVELHSFVVENTEDLTDEEIDGVVEEFKNDVLGLRDFVNSVLG